MPRSLPLSLLCPFEPALDCRASVLPARSKLVLKRHPTRAARDRLMWRLAKGDTTAVSDFGDPTQDTFYELCLYTRVEGRPSLLLHPDILNGPGWKARRNGFVYKAKRDVHPDGVRKLRLKGGGGGRVKLKLDGKGENLTLPTLPMNAELPLVAQLHNSLGLCWEAIYSDPAVKSTETLYRHWSD